MAESNEEIVERYFSVYLGHSLSEVHRGQIIPVSCERRLRPEIGWEYTVAIWAHIFRERAIVSVRPDLFQALEKTLEQRPTPSELDTLDWRKNIGSLVGPKEIGKVSHVLFCSAGNSRVFHAPGCRRLQDSDVGLFVQMKQDLYPRSDPDCLATDIRRNIEDGIAFGVFEEGKLVSVSEAPAIGHMQELIEELGVDTRPEFQQRGYGKAVVSAMTRAVLNLGRKPIYQVSSTNKASIGVARSIGYKKHADILKFKLD